MNYQLLRKASTNYQLNQNRAFNYQTQPFSPLPSVRGLKQTVNGSRAVLHGGMLEDGGSSWGMLEDGGSSWGKNRKKMRVKQHVTVT
jgi:hypothetical protein